MLTDEIKRAARKEWCREEYAQMGEPPWDLCEGNCEECEHKFEDGLLFAAIEEVAPMIRDAAIREVVKNAGKSVEGGIYAWCEEISFKRDLCQAYGLDPVEMFGPDLAPNPSLTGEPNLDISP